MFLKKDPSRADVIWSGVFAAAWAVLVILAIARQMYSDSILLFLLNVLNLVLWSGGFFVCRRRYCSRQEK